MNKQTREKLNTVIEEFDFERVLAVMNFLNWTWVGEEISIPVLINQAVNLLNRCYDGITDPEKEIDSSREDDYCISIGGFKATAYKEDKEYDFTLEFVIAEWDTF